LTSTWWLTTGADVVTGTDVPLTVEGTAAALSSAATLNANDKITGSSAKDTAKLDLQASFAGFTKDQGFMKDVEVVELTNSGVIQRSFAAKEVTGVTEYVLKGDAAGIDLTDLASIPTSVSISGQKAGTANIGFATDVTKGTTDALTIKLDSVGTAEVKDEVTGVISTSEAPVAVTVNGIETVTVEAAGQSVASLTGTDTKALNIAGAGNLKLKAIQAGVKTVDAAAATGALDIDLGQATGITTIATGSGNDTIRAAAGDLQITATVAGGAGQDVLKTSETGTVEYTMSGVETVEVLGTGLKFSAAKTTGLEKIVLGDAAATTEFVNLGAIDLTVDMQKSGSTLAVDNAGALTANVKASAAATKDLTEASTTAVTAANATAVTLNVAKFAEFSGKIDAKNATQATLSVDGKLADAEFIGAKAAAVVVTTTDAAVESSLKLDTAKLENLSVTAAGKFTVKAGSAAGSAPLQTVQTLTVDTANAFSAAGLDLLAANSVTLSGAGDKAAVTLANVGAGTLPYGVNLTASGLKAGLSVGAVDAGAGQSINLNVAGVTGKVVAGNITVAATDAGANTGAVTVNAATVGGALTLGNIKAKSINVDASAVKGAVELGKLVGDVVTLNVAKAEGAVTVGTAADDITAKTSVTYTGQYLKANALDIVASTDSTALTVSLTGGMDNDTFNVTAGTASKSIVVSGDLGLGTNTVVVDLTPANAAATDTLTLDASGLTANTAGTNSITLKGNLVGKNVITGSAASDKITGGAAVDTINGGAGNDIIDGGAGDDILSGGAGADTFILGTVTAAGMDTIKDFSVAEGDIIQTVTGANTKAVALVDKGTLTGADFATVLATFAASGANETEAMKAYTFTYGTDKYLLIDNGTVGYAAGTDSLVKITGIVGELTADQIFNAVSGT